MRAVVMRNKQLVLDTVPDPMPTPGQVVVKTLACGICGSDLHALKFADRMVETARRSGMPAFMDPARDIVMGHEFCAEVVDRGPDGSGNLAPGTRVCSMPVAFDMTGIKAIGYSNDLPGGYGEFMVLNEMLLLPVPNGLPTEVAALTEPMAVGWHAVNKARFDANDVPLVIGINKELNVQFVLGYTPQEFAETLGLLAEGAIDAAPMITGKVGLEGIAGAFEELGNPEQHAKILAEPWR